MGRIGKQAEGAKTHPLAYQAQKNAVLNCANRGPLQVVFVAEYSVNLLGCFTIFTP